MLKISTDPRLLNVPWMVESILGSYWGGHLESAQVSRAIANSLIFAAYDDGEQIGFIRVVTDHSCFSSITDAFVAQHRRNEGVGRAMMEAVVTHPSVAPTICILRSRDACALYRKFGFLRIELGGDVMQRNPRN